MIMPCKGNEKHKDHVFRYLFSDEKNFAELYYDITGETLDADELEFYDTESIVVKQLKNDVAFKTKDNRLIIMVEHQSTINENMPLRFLLYYAELLKVYIIQKELNIFAKRALGIPTPEFYVAYNGKPPLEETELFLNENLDGNDQFITIRATALDINYDKLPSRSKGKNHVLEGYSYLMDRIRTYHKTEKKPLEEAIQKAKEDSLAKGYLVEYLQRKEFETMLAKVLTIEEEIELIKLEERQEGRQEERAEMLVKLLTTKFGPLPQELQNKIYQLDGQKLEELVAHIFDYQDLKDIRKRLH